MADAPQYVKGDASVTEPQLAQGAASDLNQASQDIPTEQAQPPQFPVQTAKPETGPVQMGGDDALLFGPTQRPNEDIRTGIGVDIGKPDNIGTSMRMLEEAAKDPQAPPQIRNLLALLTYHTQNG